MDLKQIQWHKRLAVGPENQHQLQQQPLQLHNQLGGNRRANAHAFGTERAPV